MPETNINSFPEKTQVDRESRLPVVKEKKPKQRERILQFMISYSFPVSPSFIEYKLGIKASSASKVLGLLSKDGEIKKLSHGYFIREPIQGGGIAICSDWSFSAEFRCMC